MEASKEIIFKVVKGKNVYRFCVPEGAPLAESYDASIEFMAEHVRLINEHAEQFKKQEEPVVVVEEDVKLVEGEE